MSFHEADEKESRGPRSGGDPRSVSITAPRNAHRLSYSLRDSIPKPRQAYQTSCLMLRSQKIQVEWHRAFPLLPYNLLLSQMPSTVRSRRKKTYRTISMSETSSHDQYTSTLNHRLAEKGEALSSRRAWTTVQMPERSHHTCTLLMENHFRHGQFRPRHASIVPTEKERLATSIHPSADRIAALTSRPRSGNKRWTILTSFYLKQSRVTVRGSNFLRSKPSQEDNEELAIRFYRRTYEVNFFMLSHFQNADLQNQENSQLE